MTIEQKRKILKRIVTIDSDITTLKGVVRDLATSPYVSATLSSGGGSKSYTKRNIGELTELIETLTDELNGLRKMLSGDNPALPTKIIPIYI